MDLLCICTIYDFFSTPENWKDYIIPFISPIIGVGGAYWIAHWQYGRQKALDTENKKQKLNLKALVVWRINDKTLRAITKWHLMIQNLIKYSTISNFYKMPVYVFDTGVLQPVKDLGYNVLFEITLDYLDTGDDEVNEYWDAITMLEKHFTALSDYQNRVTESYHEDIQSLNRFTGQIFLIATGIKHFAFETEFNKILNDFNVAQQEEFNVENIKTLVHNLRVLFGNDKFEKIVDYMMIQQVNNAWEILNRLDSQIDKFCESVKRYFEILNQTEQKIMDYQAVLDKKLWIRSRESPENT